MIKCKRETPVTRQLMQYRLLRAQALGAQQAAEELEYLGETGEASAPACSHARAVYADRLARAEIALDQLEERIAAVEDARMREVLRLRYIHGLPWEEIAEQMYYSLRWVHKLHRRALEELA